MPFAGGALRAVGVEPTVLDLLDELDVRRRASSGCVCDAVPPGSRSPADVLLHAATASAGAAPRPASSSSSVSRAAASSHRWSTGTRATSSARHGLPRGAGPGVAIGSTGGGSGPTVCYKVSASGSSSTGSSPTRSVGPTTTRGGTTRCSSHSGDAARSGTAGGTSSPSRAPQPSQVVAALRSRGWTGHSRPLRATPAPSGRTCREDLVSGATGSQHERRRHASGPARDGAGCEDDPVQVIADLKALWPLQDFRKLFAVRLVSQTADGMFQVGLATLFFFSPENASTATGVATAFAVLLLPFTIVGPWAGVLLDRWRRRQVLFVGNLVRVALTVVIALIMVTDGVGPAVYVLALVNLSINRFLLSALSASLPRTVDGPLLLTANSLTPTLGAAAAGVGGGDRLRARPGAPRGAHPRRGRAVRSPPRSWRPPPRWPPGWARTGWVPTSAPTPAR